MANQTIPAPFVIDRNDLTNRSGKWLFTERNKKDLAKMIIEVLGFQCKPHFSYKQSNVNAEE